ncbi:hypothetical protein [Desulfuromonas acetoxidans]|uniref:Uncharacterized protein n=1 Tax=Desulfuromonas acetoxidans (strain DSM 684 / 11070) TaxID=281689 RepID=Q1JWF6_DESA6|nr:hypothetical protein [Desulfuromonas acetoxidans]EAT14612.1 conserved hypothetical protein [Desulfuromonas acetoxidans DSM 684]MBF0645641.1 hypothetical protein [Desulfuromonas acetoxidans]NVD24142.1 hypothetical protein [Desulfuromonas acetoxidans]NVE16438.1 hypothetical protein [Desulfuromonas acetoxidans]
MKKHILFTLLVLLLSATSVMAHTALMSCFDEGDGTITCEGGFSDGSSASGVEVRIEQQGKVLLKTKMDDYSEVNFKKPQGDYTVIFHAGEGHSVTVSGKDIVE